MSPTERGHGVTTGSREHGGCPNSVISQRGGKDLRHETERESGGCLSILGSAMSSLCALGQISSSLLPSVSSFSTTKCRIFKAFPFSSKEPTALAAGMRAVCEEIRLLVSFRNLGPSALPSWGWEQAQHSLTNEGEFQGGGWQHGRSQTSDSRRTALGKPHSPSPRLSLVYGLDALHTEASSLCRLPCHSLLVSINGSSISNK